ncbi:MAG: hypothetical protein ACLP62_13105 [Acidimicrobiales bacterium]
MAEGVEIQESVPPDRDLDDIGVELDCAGREATFGFFGLSSTDGVLFSSAARASLDLSETSPLPRRAKAAWQLRPDTPSRYHPAGTETIDRKDHSWT